MICRGVCAFIFKMKLRITDAKGDVLKEKESLEQQIVQYQRELQRVNDATAETEKNVVRLTKKTLPWDSTRAKPKGKCSR